MIIYKTTNLINLKVYVGKDSRNNPYYLGSGKILISAIKKHGRENFKKEILEICYSEKELNEREIYWINKLDSRNKKIGYNITPGGAGGSIKGRIFTEEHIKNLSESHKGKQTWMKGRKHKSETISLLQEKRHTEKSKNRISSSLMGRKASEDARKNIGISHSKNIIQIDKSGKIINFFNSMKEAQEKTGINCGHIGKVCSGKRKSSGGFIWKFKKDIK